MKTENQMLRNGKSANCNEKRSQKIAKTAQDSSLTFVTSGVSWKQRPLRPQNLIPWVHFVRNKCFVFAWLLKDLYWRHVRRKCFVRSLQTKRAIYLMKTPFQLHHNYFKLHNILMSLHVESDSYDRSGVGMYSCKKLSWKTRVFCVLLWRNKFIDTFLVNTFSIWWLNYFSVASWRLPKKIYFGPWVLLSQYSRKNYTPPQKNHVFVRWKTSLFFSFPCNFSCWQ